MFAAGEAREPLLCMYALMAEWHALLDPGTEAAVAQIKLGWWREELQRLAAGSPLHPITRHIADLPHARTTELGGLEAVVEAAAAEVAGVPLERAAELDSHADALYGLPLRVSARFGAPPGQRAAMHACTGALAAAQYVTRSLHGYRREAQAGRITFPVDELLAAGIDNAALIAAVPPPHLASYLQELRRKAAGYFATAARALDPADRPALRHLAVLARLGATHLQNHRNPASADFHFADLYNAWNAARRAAAGR